MKALLVIVSVSLLATSIVAAQQSSRKNQKATKAQPPSTQKQQPNSSNPPVVGQNRTATQPTEQQKTPEEHNSAQERHDWIDKLNAVSTTIIAFFTVLLFVGIVFQIKAYRDKERAWVMFFIVDHPVSNAKSGQTLFTFVGFIKNVGGSPAIILDGWHCGETIGKDKQLPKEPRYVGQERNFQTEYPMVPQGAQPVTFDLTVNDMDKVRSGEDILYIYGFIKYRDIFGSLRENRYCYRYFPPGGGPGASIGYFPEGPNAYNRVT